MSVLHSLAQTWSAKLFIHLLNLLIKEPIFLPAMDFVTNCGFFDSCVFFDIVKASVTSIKCTCLMHLEKWRKCMSLLKCHPIRVCFSRGCHSLNYFIRIYSTLHLLIVSSSAHHWDFTNLQFLLTYYHDVMSFAH